MTFQLEDERIVSVQLCTGTKSLTFLRLSPTLKWNELSPKRLTEQKHVCIHSHGGYLLTPWCRVLLEKLTGLQLVKKFHAILWNPKVHYRTQKRPPPFPVLGQPNPVHIPTSHLLENHPNITHPSTPRSPQWSLSLRFPHQDTIRPLSSPIRATSPAHLILLDFITRTILGEEYRLLSSLLCNLLHSPVTSSLLGQPVQLYSNYLMTNTVGHLPLSHLQFRRQAKRQEMTNSVGQIKQAPCN